MKDSHSQCLPLQRRNFIRTLCAGAVTIGAPVLSRAEDVYPSRLVMLISPWPAGAGGDATIRAFANAASKHLKQPIVVENVPGVGGTLGPVRMARSAKPDGYTVASIPAGIYRMPAMRKVDWDPIKDFSYISCIGRYQGAFVVRADSPFKTLSDLIEFARANPGKVTYGSVGIGTGNHLSIAGVALKAGVDLTHVPYKGSAESLNALLGGHIMLASSESAAIFIDEGRLRALAISEPKRSNRWPDVPTLTELGYESSPSLWGWAGPAGMDPRIVAYLDSVAKQVMEDTEFAATMAKNNQLLYYMNTTDYKAYVLQELSNSKQLMERLGLVGK